MDFEERIFDLIAFGTKPLSKLDKLKGKTDEETLYNIALLAKEKFADSSLTLANLKVPEALPEDIKKPLEEVKTDLSIGFKALEESMNYFAQYIVNRNPIFYDMYIEQRDRGFLYIDGGLTSLTTVRLRLDSPEVPPPNAWKVGKRNFYELEKAVLIKSVVK
ncbi:hypothetical protein [Oceanobacillus zhaokaii]|uniref:hypothetical protein n=1 Tax=Oceanobacillus zhaokaii TaxID=2052660 RepID=UPI001962344D|nr:hypothetical protein [Oceanobacillus zhaokaii]